MDRKNCSTCDENISVNANKCIHCGSYQDWRKRLNFSSNILSLLVALTAVLGVTIPIIVETFETKETVIVGTLSSREITPINDDDRDVFNILFTNKGTVGGAISQVYVVIDNDKKIRATLPTDYLHKHDYYIGPGKTILLPFYVELGMVPENGCKILVKYIDHNFKTVDIPEFTGDSIS